MRKVALPILLELVVSALCMLLWLSFLAALFALVVMTLGALIGWTQTTIVDTEWSSGIALALIVGAAIGLLTGWLWGFWWTQKKCR